MGCLAFGSDKIPHYADGIGRGCVGCQHCMAICPTGALSFGGINPDELPKASYGNPNEVLNLIRSRRSFRSYRQQDVPAEKLELIRQMLAYPPTGANLPDLHFSIIGTREKMDKIREATYRNVMADRSSIRCCKNNSGIITSRKSCCPIRGSYLSIMLRRPIRRSSMKQPSRRRSRRLSALPHRSLLRSPGSITFSPA